MGRVAVIEFDPATTARWSSLAIDKRYDFCRHHIATILTSGTARRGGTRGTWRPVDTAMLKVATACGSRSRRWCLKLGIGQFIFDKRRRTAGPVGRGTPDENCKAKRLPLLRRRRSGLVG